MRSRRSDWLKRSHSTNSAHESTGDGRRRLIGARLPCAGAPPRRPGRRGRALAARAAPARSRARSGSPARRRAVSPRHAASSANDAGAPRRAGSRGRSRARRRPERPDPGPDHRDEAQEPGARGATARKTQVRPGIAPAFPALRARRRASRACPTKLESGGSPATSSVHARNASAQERRRCAGTAARRAALRRRRGSRPAPPARAVR